MATAAAHLIWRVHKFGGTSVANSDCIRNVADIVCSQLLNETTRIAVVVSAMGGVPKVTDMLLDCVKNATVNNLGKVDELLSTVLTKHVNAISNLITGERSSDLVKLIESDIKDIKDVLRAVTLMRGASDSIYELISGYGEVWSASMLAAFLHQNTRYNFEFLNAREVLIVDAEDTRIHWERSQELMDNFVTGIGQSDQVKHLVITGYVASTPNGVATTLKRDGSDYSASIFGRLLHADNITIWTDVSGVLSADPRRVPDAQVIPEVSYEEAMELAYFGAKVIHPKTMQPAIMDKIPIFIKNTFAPEMPGTRIFTSSSSRSRPSCVCGFSTIDGMALINLEGAGMIGVPGIAHRLFGALQQMGISVTLIAQASSEHSICFATRAAVAQQAKRGVEDAFMYELKQQMISRVDVVEPCSIIAAVGDAMSHTAGVAGTFLGALGKQQINILAISQGCSERNISAVVRAEDSARALRAVHAAFLLSTHIIHVGVIGLGQVGAAFIQTLKQQSHLLKNNFNVEVVLRGVLKSDKMLLGENLLQAEDVISSVVDSPMRSDMDSFLKHVKGNTDPHAILVDCTASAAVALHHPNWLTGGFHVVTANKLPLAMDLELYNRIREERRITKRMYMYEVTIAAGIPVITTIQDLMNSGDVIEQAVGVMSVSLCYVCSRVCHDRVSLSTAVTEAHRLGLFETDPWDDLTGREVAMKLLVLGREIGIPLTQTHIDIEPFIQRREVASWDNLGRSFASDDEVFAKRVEDAHSRGNVLRYVCTLQRGEGTHVHASVRLQELSLTNPLAQVRGAAYSIAFHTERYRTMPLIVQGPLAGPFATGGGIFSDVLRIARSIGAPDLGPGAIV